MRYRLVIVSDIHRRTENLTEILPVINSSDYMVFCGDGMKDVMEVQDRILVPTVCVRGNNDYFSDIVDTAELVLGDTRAFVTHGHRYGARMGVSGLVSAAKVNNCRLVFFGHTHVFCDRVADGVHLINPGALCDGSYAVVTGDGIEFTCKQQFV